MKKDRVILPLLFVLVVAVSVAESVAAAPPTSSAAVSSESFMCSLSQASSLELSGSAVAPAGNFCGSCSQDPCGGLSVGTLCYEWRLGTWGWCIPPNMGICEEDGNWNCQCAGGYN